MIRQELIDGINSLIENELDDALKKHGEFHSPHEAYAVTREEFDEVLENIRRIDNYFAILWAMTKRDDGAVTDVYENIRKDAMFCALECIQVAAMCDKFNKF